MPARCFPQCAFAQHPPRLWEPAAFGRASSLKKEPVSLSLKKEPAALRAPRRGACRRFLTEEVAALPLSTERPAGLSTMKEPAAVLRCAEETAALGQQINMPVMSEQGSVPRVHEELREPAT